MADDVEAMLMFSGPFSSAASWVNVILPSPFSPEDWSGVHHEAELLAVQVPLDVKMTGMFSPSRLTVVLTDPEMLILSG